MLDLCPVFFEMSSRFKKPADTKEILISMFYDNNHLLRCFILFIAQYNYTAHNNKWDFYVVRTSLNLSARITKSSIYFCVEYIMLFTFE